MRLSELKTGENGVIVKVHGHGGFRKRIVEMGFIRGTKVEVLLNAPLHDPVKYKVLDYEVSLRRAEAELVEVVTTEEAKQWRAHQVDQSPLPADDSEVLHQVALEKRKTINVVFVGNPNCGKTSIFNVAGHAHERVGNYSGVTVDAKKGELTFEGYHFNIIDLPGTYSLSAYTPEELYVRKYIIEQTPDVIINVVDASNLERNLYLTTQLIDMDMPMIMALNMYDELRESGDRLDVQQLATLLGVPVIPTVAKTGEGIEDLLHTTIHVYEGPCRTGDDEDRALRCKSCDMLCHCPQATVKNFRHIHVNHGSMLEAAIQKIEQPIRKNPEPHHNYSGRFMAIKLLENDSQIREVIAALPNAQEIFDTVALCQTKIQHEMDDTSENAITDAKYGFVQGALRECLIKAGKRMPSRELTKKIDAIVTNKWCGYLIFLALLYLMFYVTFAIGQYPMDWIDAFVGWLGETVSQKMPEGVFKDLIVDGIIAGVGGVFVFLPNILILYAFISWMEDSGYMARAAFIMDRVMHGMGLHGKSFIPMIMGFGCNIPAIMATRTIEDRKSRLITMLIVPLMSCSARLPVYIIIGAFFPNHQAEVLFSLYLIGIIMSILMAHLFSRTVVRGESSPFVMELPPYRLPSTKSVLRHTWEKGRQYLRKMGTVILAASIVVWALTYFPRPTEGMDGQLQMEQSYIGRLGKAIEPVIAPCGFEWKEGVSIITGIGAKEIVASTMGVLYGAGDAEAIEDDEDAEGARLSQIIAHSGLTPLAAFSFLIFVLLYMPCIPACVSISKESGHWRWALFTIAYTTALAWVCSTLVFQIGSLF